MKIQQSTENVNSNSGLALINLLIDQLSSLNGFEHFQRSQLSLVLQTFSNIDIIKCVLGLMTLGKTHFSDITDHRVDFLFQSMIHAEEMPSEETLRQRFEWIAKQDNHQDLVDMINVELLKKVKNFGLSQTSHGSYLPVDIDVSVLINEDCLKEMVSYTYHHKNGFAPIFATIGTEGFQLTNELRTGSQHSQKDAVTFIHRTIKLAQKLSSDKLLVRMDSAHDADETLQALFTYEKVKFIIKRNPRNESKEKVYDWIKASDSQPKRTSEHTTIYQGVISHKKTSSTQDLPLFCVFEFTVIERPEELFPITALSTWWTNLTETAEECIRLYREHATSEQFHSELKTDMDVELLPCHCFKGNTLFLQLASVSFNMLRIISTEAIDAQLLITKSKKPRRFRLRSILLKIIYVGAIIKSHARQLSLCFGRNCYYYPVIKELHKRILNL